MQNQQFSGIDFIASFRQDWDDESSPGFIDKAGKKLDKKLHFLWLTASKLFSLTKVKTQEEWKHLLRKTEIFNIGCMNFTRDYQFEEGIDEHDAFSVCESISIVSRDWTDFKTKKEQQLNRKNLSYIACNALEVVDCMIASYLNADLDSMLGASLTLSEYLVIVSQMNHLIEQGELLQAKRAQGGRNGRRITDEKFQHLVQMVRDYKKDKKDSPFKNLDALYEHWNEKMKFGSEYVRRYLKPKVNAQIKAEERKIAERQRLEEYIKDYPERIKNIMRKIYGISQ